MKGREAIEKIVSAYMVSTEEDFAEEVALVEDTLISFGWLPPETIAQEYVRMDKVVEGRYKCGYKMLCKLLVNGICTKNCPCEDQRPATVADLIGGKG